MIGIVYGRVLSAADAALRSTGLPGLTWLLPGLSIGLRSLHSLVLL